MRVGVGYSENSYTVKAGRQAAAEALKEAGRSCDLALLFSTSYHEPRLLRSAVASELGPNTPIIGGGTIGAITNDHFGYAGDQVIVAAIRLEACRCETLVQGGLHQGEEEAGLELGRKLAALGADASSPVMLFFDSTNRSREDLGQIMATPLLEGLERGLGSRPNLVGAGLTGDYLGSAAWQWTGHGLDRHSALALAFSENIRLDSVVMHGCRPATGYYTVTRADRQVILEINGQPAMTCMDRMLGGFIKPEDYPFSLILGVNNGGDKWAPFEEENYASRLCYGLDLERKGLVMFEPDMAEGAEFQVMYRSLDLDYMPPKVNALFKSLGGRRPVFATYFNCAGHAAGRAWLDMEDAVIIQREIAGRVPLLGLYTGVGIATVRGRPRSLDWTGVLTLFSVNP
jgi:hypothetical protein